MTTGGLWSKPAHYRKTNTQSANKKRAQPERSLQIRVATMLSWMLPPEVPWTAISPGVINPADREKAARMGARLKAAGLHAGWPDLMLIVKGRFVGIELKASTYLSPIQKQVHAQIVAAGGVVRVCKSEEDVIAFLDVLGVPRNKVRLSPAERASGSMRAVATHPLELK